jgi:hypothetical protein
VIFINIQDELKIIGSYPSVMFNGREVPPSPKYNTPLPPGRMSTAFSERAALSGHPAAEIL